MAKKSTPKIYLLSFFFITVLYLFTWFQSHASEKKETTQNAGEALPDFNVPSIVSGQNFTPKDMLGKVAMLNVWTIKCHYCREEYNFLFDIKKDYHVPLYSLSFRDDLDSVKSWVQSKGNPYEKIGLDSDGSVAAMLGVTSTPVAFIVDSHGMVRFQVQGMITKKIWDEKIYPEIKKLQEE